MEAEILHKKKIIAPKLRFKEFNGEITTIDLENVSSIRTGPFGSVLHQEDYAQEGTPIITVEHLSDQGIVHENLPLVSDSDKERLKSYILSEGDIVFSRVGSVDRNSIVSSKENGWLFSGRLLRIRTTREIILPRFLGYYFQLEVTKHRIRSVSVGQTMASLNTEILKSFSIQFPKQINEQQKIASFLLAIDKKIQQLTRKKELLEQYKKGVMQQLFSGKLRFKDENGTAYPKWEEKRLGEVCTFFSGGTPASTNRKFYTGTIPFIGSGNIYDSEVFSFISEEALNSSSAKIVEKGDLLYALYGANSGEVAISKINGAINQAILCIRSEECIEYLYYILLLDKDRIVAKYLQGGQGNLSANIIKRLKFKLPSIEEQLKIANYLSAIDTRIESVATQITQTQTFKKGLMQQMFV
jgi:type I restriction enzyme, S subunit